jgi:hypothetical protein
VYVTLTSTGTAGAICPQDHPYVLGGGGISQNNLGKLSMSLPIESEHGTPATPQPERPASGGGNGWLVGGDGTVTAWAICAK